MATVAVIQTILVPVDDSQAALDALRFAIIMSRLFDARIVGILLEHYVWPTGDQVDDELVSGREELAEQTIEHCRDLCSEWGVSFSATLRSGRVHRRASGVGEDVDLIVVSASGNEEQWGRGRLRRSGIEELMKRTRDPIIVTPVPMGEHFDEIRKVVFAYDGKVRSRQLIRLVAEICRRSEARLVVVTVGEDRKSLSAPFHSELKAVFKGLEWSHELLGREVGSAAHGIWTMILQEKPQLLAMGSAVRSRLRDRVLPNTTHHLLEMVPCPILFGSKKLET